MYHLIFGNFDIVMMSHAHNDIPARMGGGREYEPFLSCQFEWLLMESFYDEMLSFFCFVTWCRVMRHLQDVVLLLVSASGRYRNRHRMFSKCPANVALIFIELQTDSKLTSMLHQNMSHYLWNRDENNWWSNSEPSPTNPDDNAKWSKIWTIS